MRKETAISNEVRARVYERDSYDGAPCCIKCGSPYGIELHHVVSRGRGGRGIETNLVCLCQKHHRAFHDGDASIKQFCIAYLEGLYPGWREEDQIYRRRL